MSRLDELIKDLCPDGVESKKLKDVCTEIIVPMRDRPKVFDGTIPWCRIEDKEGRYFHKSLSGLGVSQEVIDKMNLKVFPEGTVICSCSASIGHYAINTQPLITNQTFIGLVCGERLYNKYLLYFMETQTEVLKSLTTTSTIPYISRKKFEELLVPVPPLEIQEEIVKLLDEFTDYVIELQAELQAEIHARRQQYEYYRECLTFGTNSKIVPLSEICDIKGRIGFRGYTKNDIVPAHNGAISFSPGNITNEHIFYENCTYISWEKYYESPEIMIEEGDIILCKTGSTLGKVALVENLLEKATINPQLVVLKNVKCNNRYLKYVIGGSLFQNEMQRRKGLGSVPNISQKEIGSIKVTIPDIVEQKRMVAILDKLAALSNNISSSLPAEIEARQKQYEYYRDKLLTFKELS